MYVAAICFPWVDEPPYPWRLRRERDQSPGYWRWAWGHMAWAGVNACALVVGDTEGWRRAIATQMEVLRESLPGVAMLPQIGKAAFARWPGWNQPVPAEARRIADHLSEQALAWAGMPIVEYQGRPVWAMLGNVPGIRDWPVDLLCNIGHEMDGPAPAWFVGADLVRAGFHHEEEYNPFGPNRSHLKLTPPTAAVRPGFWHGSMVGGRFVPRDGGGMWRAAIRAAVDAGCEYLILESEGELKEGSSFLPSHTKASREVAEWHDDEWGRGSRRYLKILRQELRRGQ